MTFVSRMTWLAIAAGMALVPAATRAQACAVLDANGNCLCPAPGQVNDCALPLDAAGVPIAPFQPLLPALQPKFVNELPVPIFFEPDREKFPGFDYYEVAMQPVQNPGVAFPQPRDAQGIPQPGLVPPGKQWVGLVAPDGVTPVYTPVWGYAQTSAGTSPYALQGIATWPSMSFKATKGTPTKVLWVNKAPDQHLFCPDPANSDVPCGIDRTLMGTLLDLPDAAGLFDGVLDPAAGERVNPFGGPMQPDNAMVVHLHGGEIPPDSDGMAELWIGNANTSRLYTPAPPVVIDPVTQQPIPCTVDLAAGVTPASDLLTQFACGAFYRGAYDLANSPNVTADVLPHFTPPAGNGIPATYPADNFDAGQAGVFYQPGQLMRPTGDRIMYNYPNVQQSATIWYHDHALGKTRVNVAAGPAGFYVVRTPGYDDGPAATLFQAGALPPEGDCSVSGTLAGNCYDVPIAFQDRAFNADGSINFPSFLGQPNPAIVGWNPLTPGDLPNIHPQWLPEYFGDVPVINGVAWPKMTVEPRPYRFRFLGGSNARCWSLTLKAVNPLVLTKPPMYVVATEQGYLPQAINVSRLTFCPGERYEVVIDFSGFARGTQFHVSNSAGAPFPNGAVPRAGGAFQFMANVMRFDVSKPLVGAAAPYWAGLPLGNNKPVPGKVFPGVTLTNPAPTVFREMVLNEVLDPLGIPVRVQIDAKPFEAPVTETPARGATEGWSFINTTVDAHPIHLHLVKFRTLDRQKFDNKAFSLASGVAALTPAGGAIDKNVKIAPYLVGKARPPEPWEAGWKDTVIAYPGEVTRVIATWDGGWSDCAPGSATSPLCWRPAAAGQPYFEAVTAGPYVWHCHIVDHEDNEMMRPSLVLPAPPQ
jgi:FtsP/CotA-like multicopper oxidase with cupredoxin domain